ncbi:hypothetical protein UK23_29385 [Lentzea aerocolonigenes]|uniref:DUF1963 domain-containing protein n=1 Tax=Lentzea aerocolonigenes TaxID=68170 RepID=A0A0F0GMB2_LENAE|nr:hypothetical protein UK23_29385 [Lentzea aerocolonigenes]
MPGIDEWARPVVELNPAPGEPTAADSHIGGPLLWPADEPWPHCDGSTHEGSTDSPSAHAVGVRVPFVSALQLYRRDFPELPFPADTDVLQVFLCTLRHERNWGPDVHVVWRDTARVTTTIAEEPRPELQEPDLAPAPRLLKPVRDVEYPMLEELPKALIDSLEAAQEDYDEFFDTWPDVATGSKIGGWTAWWQTGPGPGPECPECGDPRRQTLALATHEPSGDDVGWEFGREGVLNVFMCPRDVNHPFEVHID